jgi:Xaa-Pro dipeptidase
LIDEEKRRRIRKGLARAGISALILRYPENVVYATGYWPCWGWSTCIYPLDGEPVLILPECERRFAVKVGFRDLRPIKDDYGASTVQIISEVVAEKHLERSTVGIEASFETIAANHVGGEANFPNDPSFDRMRVRLPECRLLDATSLLYELRSIKSGPEVERLKLANRIAAEGLGAARDALGPGMKETEVASAAERAIHAFGVGHRGVLRARGFAFVMSGPLSAEAYMPFNISTARRIRRGDLVLIELNTYADGYWSDLTRVWVCGGRPTAKQAEMYDIVRGGAEDALKRAGDGIGAEEPYLAAKDFIGGTRYGRYFLPFLGHGIGARMHEPVPMLIPGSKDVLRRGMVHSVEPGIYIKGFGGMRIEDDVLDMGKRATSLSTFERTLET